MRDYYRKILNRTYEIFGVSQTAKMDEDQIVFLLDALERVSEIHSYIPQEEQKKIIDKCMLEDTTYQNINARLISKWLELHGKKFYTEVAHKESLPPEGYKVATGAEREMYIQQFLEAIANATDNLTSNMQEKGGSGSKLKQALEQSGIVETDERILEKQRKLQYKQQCYDQDGNANESWLPYDEWLKKNLAVE